MFLPQAKAAPRLAENAQPVGNDIQVGLLAGIARGYREFRQPVPAGIGDGDNFQIDVEARAEFREVKRLQEFCVIDDKSAVTVGEFLPEREVFKCGEERAAESFVEGHVTSAGRTRDDAARALDQREV